jgi:demethylphylloquinol methyltransferase
MLGNIVVPAARQRGLTEEYEYLRPSIQAFPQGKEQERLAVDAGFQSAVHYEIALGLMGCLVATKGAQL